MFPEAILSSASVVQRILDFVVALPLPSEVHEDSALHINHELARFASVLLLSLPSPNFLSDLQELDLLH